MLNDIFTCFSQFKAPSRGVCQDRLMEKKELTEGLFQVLIFKKAGKGRFRHRFSDRQFNRNRIFWQLCFDGNRRRVSSKEPLESLAGTGGLLTNIWIPLLKHNAFQSFQGKLLCAAASSRL